MINITINGKNYEFEKQVSALQACESVGIEIPTLCHDARLAGFSACRMCLVEIEGKDKLETSCSMNIKDGMSILTDSKKVIETRKGVLDLLLSNHPMECLTCDKSGECKLQDYAYDYGLADGSHKGEMRDKKIDSSNPFYYYDPEKCILCGLCVRVCDEIQGTNAIGFENRGFDTIVATPFNIGLDHSKCVSCGNCVSVCPVGALVPKTREKFRHWQTKKTRTTCSYCGVGCQLDLITKDDKVVGVQPAFDAVNNGMLCVKGKFGYKFLSHPDRLSSPLIKKDGEFHEATWEEAYSLIASKIKDTKSKYGSEAFGGFSSARCTNEENYLFQKLIRAVIGTNSVDHCARL